MGGVIIFRGEGVLVVVLVVLVVVLVVLVVVSMVVVVASHYSYEGNHH